MSLLFIRVPRASPWAVELSPFRAGHPAGPCAHHASLPPFRRKKNRHRKGARDPKVSSAQGSPQPRSCLRLPATPHKNPHKPQQAHRRVRSAGSPFGAPRPQNASDGRLGFLARMLKGNANHQPNRRLPGRHPPTPRAGRSRGSCGAWQRLVFACAARRAAPTGRQLPLGWRRTSMAFKSVWPWIDSRSISMVSAARMPRNSLTRALRGPPASAAGSMLSATVLP